MIRTPSDVATRSNREQPDRGPELLTRLNV